MIFTYGIGYGLAELSYPESEDNGDDVTRIRRITDLLPQTSDELVRTALLVYDGCDMNAQFDIGLDLMIRGLDVREVNIWDNPRAAARVRTATGGDETVPTAFVGNHTLVNPSFRQIETAVREHVPTCSMSRTRLRDVAAAGPSVALCGERTHPLPAAPNRRTDDPPKDHPMSETLLCCSRRLRWCYITASM